VHISDYRVQTETAWDQEQACKEKSASVPSVGIRAVFLLLFQFFLYLLVKIFNLNYLIEILMLYSAILLYAIQM